MLWMYLAAAVVFAVAMIARSQAEGVHFADANPLVTALLVATLAAALAAWVGIALGWRRMVGRFRVTELATVGLVSCVQFLVSFAAGVVNTPLALAGPFAFPIQGLGNELARCVIVGMLVVLVPRPGTYMLSTLCVFLLMSLTSGILGLTSFLFVTVSIVLGEAMLWLLGVTRAGQEFDGAPPLGELAESSVSRRWNLLVVRVALAIGLANGLKMFVQYLLSQLIYRAAFPAWFVAAQAAIALLYGGAGAALGSYAGNRLRRVSW